MVEFGTPIFQFCLQIYLWHFPSKGNCEDISFAYLEMIFHPGLQVKESSQSETGMNLHCLFLNQLVLGASSGLQHSEFWAWLTEKEMSCLPMPIPTGMAGCSVVCKTWWLGLLRRKKESRQKQSRCFYFCLSTPHSSAKSQQGSAMESQHWSQPY